MRTTTAHTTSAPATRARGTPPAVASVRYPPSRHGCAALERERPGAAIGRLGRPARLPRTDSAKVCAIRVLLCRGPTLPNRGARDEAQEVVGELLQRDDGDRRQVGGEGTGGVGSLGWLLSLMRLWGASGPAPS